MDLENTSKIQTRLNGPAVIFFDRIIGAELTVWPRSTVNR
jgi:hypothetical protein